MMLISHEETMSLRDELLELKGEYNALQRQHDKLEEVLDEERADHAKEVARLKALLDMIYDVTRQA